jgi:hypothetical protein
MSFSFNNNKLLPQGLSNTLSKLEIYRNKPISNSKSPVNTPNFHAISPFLRKSQQAIPKIDTWQPHPHITHPA